MSVTCTIEARLGSSRLPGKSFYCLSGRPLVQFAIDAAKACRFIDRIILCTTTRAEDELLVQFAQALGVEFYRGSENDVAGRIAGALAENSDSNVFLTGDNPFVTPDLIGDAYEQYLAAKADYLCTTHMKYCDWWNEEPVLPTGLSVQVAGTVFFQEAVRMTPVEDPIRQHSTMVMYKTRHAGRSYQAFRLAKEFEGLCDTQFRFTVDTAADFARAQQLMGLGASSGLGAALRAGGKLAATG